MKDVNKLVNKIVYACLIIGVSISLYAFFYEFIRFKLFFRSILIYTVLFILLLMFNRFKMTDRIWSKLMIISFSILFSYFYYGYLYKVDLFVLVIPEDYIGDVEIETNNSTSLTKVKPIDGVVFLEIKKNGKFSTSSNFDIAFNRIQLLESVNGSMVLNRHLHFINKGAIKKRNNANSIYTLIKGNIVNK